MAMNGCLRCLGKISGTLNEKEISVIGTGNYGAAIGKRLVQSGYNVTFGSRRPSTRNLSSIDPSLQHAEITDIGSAIQRNDVIIFAVRVANFNALSNVYEKHLSRKIVIDVSNKSKDVFVSTSNAEYLQSLLPECSVVKAFNVISAYTLESGLDGSTRLVPIASDDAEAKDVVANLVTSMDFTPRDAGVLSAARELEDSVLRILPMWRFPAILAIGVFLLWWLYISYLYFISKTAYSWEQLFVKVLNKPLAMTAVNMFAITYLPACLAAFLQLYNGTKYKRFPDWLDFWLRSRKQLGLTAFFLASMHVLVSAMLLSPTYYSSWFHKTEVVIPANFSEEIRIVLPVTAWMTWKGEAACLTGVFAFFIFCSLAVTSVPSVGQALNWAEWRFIQSRLGIAGLFLVVSHAYVMGMPAWVSQDSFVAMLHSITFTSTIPSAIVILMKIILVLPGIQSQLRKIRRGWEKDHDATTPDDIECKGNINKVLKSRPDAYSQNSNRISITRSPNESHFPQIDNPQVGNTYFCRCGENIKTETRNFANKAVCISNRKPCSDTKSNATSMLVEYEGVQSSCCNVATEYENTSLKNPTTTHDSNTSRLTQSVALV